MLLPYFHPLGIRILGVVDAQAVAKDTLQALHHLHRQGYLRQQIKYLFLAFQGSLYEVDVYFRLPTARNAMQQYDAFLHHLQQQLVVCLLLWFGQRFDELWTIVAAMVQSAHLHFIGFQQLALHQQLQRFSR